MVCIPGGEPLLHPQIERDRRGAGRPQEVHLPLHQRPAAEGEDRPLQAEQVPDLQRPHGRPAGPPRLRRLPRGQVTTSPSRASREAVKRGFRVTTNTTLFDGADPKSVRGVLRRDDGPRRRGHDALARLHLRQGPRPEALPRQAPRTTRAVRARSSATARRAGSSTRARCSSNS